MIGYRIKFLKLVFYILKNVIVTGGTKELKCNSHTEKMTKVPQGFDFSFLSDEEARKILQVLERNEELQRAEKDRIRYKAKSFPFFLRPGPSSGPGVRGGRRELSLGTCLGSRTCSIGPGRSWTGGNLR